MTTEIFDHMPDGRPVHAIWLRGQKLSARILTMGATVQDLRLAGVAHPLVLGFPTLAPYFGPGLYVGALVGRVANRIGGARFALDGRQIRVDANEGENLLHGGRDGIHHQIWHIKDQGPDYAVLGLDLPDGHMGFPGALQIEARISVTDDVLGFDLSATTDAPTPVNLAHHGYFCLDDSGDIRGHQLQVAADHYLPVDATLIPTGAVADVSGTAFDFRTPRAIAPAGYDHNLCFASERGPLRPVASLAGQGGLKMQIETTEPGLQIYDGRHFSGTPGLDGQSYGPFAGTALETQAWPDAVNHPHFPDTILRPGERYHATTRYRFTT
ncbi:galactose mutarotase [Xinfangfangia sp. D13-10-4-6]|uniref:aldose epimerase family protein n=1 Tax=Pseudogemmobacter hezensis TaxID=2737662 RepID=UPI001555DB0F|nr:aldose epimerase family protein [Pseudogemmobacter hezensis]NPD16389.1 galactose mutarotase [Pseudogemmobacter hezensis]